MLGNITSFTNISAIRLSSHGCRILPKPRSPYKTVPTNKTGICGTSVRIEFQSWTTTIQSLKSTFFIKNLTQIFLAHRFSNDLFQPVLQFQGDHLLWFISNFHPCGWREDIDLDEAPEKTPMGPLVGLPNVDSKGFGGSKRALTTEYAWWELWPSSSLFVDGSREVFQCSTWFQEWYNSSSRASGAASLLVGMLGFCPWYPENLRWLAHIYPSLWGVMVSQVC